VFFIAVLVVSSLLSIGYLMPVVVRAFFYADDEPGRERGVREAPLLCVAPICAAALGCVALFFASQPLRDLLLPIVKGTP
jgi:multicomponent Na+:H+ antiporter subunit D